MAAFIRTFAPTCAAARVEQHLAPNTVAAGVASLTCRWRRAANGQLVAVWDNDKPRAGDEPALLGFAAAA